MPRGWVAPDLFLTHGGVNVYHCYDDDDYDQGHLTWWYTTDAGGDGSEFDVRDLPEYPKEGHGKLFWAPDPFDTIADIIRAAIDNGTLTGSDEPPEAPWVTLAPVMVEFLIGELDMSFDSSRKDGDEDTLFYLFRLRNCVQALGGDTNNMDERLLRNAEWDRRFAVKAGCYTPEYRQRIDHVVAVISGKESGWCSS